MKPIPDIMAIFLNFFLSITIFLEYLGAEFRNSDVISNINDIIASHNPISDIERKNFILFPTYHIRYLNGICIRVYFVFLNSNGFTCGLSYHTGYCAFKRGSEAT